MSDPDVQLALVPPRRAAASAKARGAVTPAAALAVAHVAVDVPLAHLDRPFDYLVPEAMDATVVPGSRVRVRFAGRLVDGFVLSRSDATDHVGRLQPIARAVSAEPVLSPQVARLCRQVADHYAGTFMDVVRLAIPPRHARAERAPQPPATAPGGGADVADGAGAADDQRRAGTPEDGSGADTVRAVEPASWSGYVNGAEYLAALASGGAPRAVWTANPGADWPTEIAVAVAATLASGRGALVVAPDVRDVRRLDAALTSVMGQGRHVVLTADLGPEVRYRRWLAVRRGAVRVVVGTRAAAFAPVADLGLVAVWDDGDDLHAEPRAPYPHARDVLVLRAHAEGAAALVGGFARTAEGQRLLETGWARPLRADRETVRRAAPTMVAAGSDADLARDPAARSARLPSAAWSALKEGLAAGGPVLVQVPRRGYVPAMACDTCRAPARCPACAGTLGATGSGQVGCRWCGRLATGWRCPECSSERWRAMVVGAGRTAEELGRAFPSVPVKTSGHGAVLDLVPATPALVVATPGAEPVAEGGYAAAVLLDGWALLHRADLRAGEEALRRWLNAAALVRPARDGGRVVVLAESGLRPVQALLRWDPATAAERELAERTELGFPPAVRMAAVSGPADAVADLIDVARLPPSASVLGPVADGDDERALIRVAHGEGAALAAALHAALGVRSARKAAGAVRVVMDPAEIE